jgi:proline iminopeptidase
MKSIFSAFIFLLLFCVIQPNVAATSPASYFDNHGRTDIQSGGVQMISINTSKGTFKVWTKRIGNNATIKVLLLHGGPGITHEYLEAFDSYFPAANIEYYYYDQLGSAYSDQPDAPELVNLSHYVEEVEQVRKALKLDHNNFYLYGQSWGGLLAMEYALKYQHNLKGLVISNMMSSVPAYNAYAKNVLMPTMDKRALSEIKKLEAAGKYDDPKYASLLKEHFYVQHVLRAPANKWPEPVERSFKHLNSKIYITMQGPSELGASGALINWDRSNDLGKIKVPTLIIGARYDTMDPKHLKWMAEQLKDGHYLYCPNGSHLAMYDDQKNYFEGLTKFLHDVDAAH